MCPLLTVHPLTGHPEQQLQQLASGFCGSLIAVCARTVNMPTWGQLMCPLALFVASIKACILAIEVAISVTVRECARDLHRSLRRAHKLAPQAVLFSSN